MKASASCARFTWVTSSNTLAAYITRPLAGSTIGEARTTIQRSSPVARTMLRTSSGGLFAADKRRAGIDSSSSSSPDSLRTVNRDMISPGSARESSSADASPSSRSAAPFGEHRRGPVVNHGNRLGEVLEHPLQALLDRRQVREQLGVVDRQRRPAGELAHELEVVFVVGHAVAEPQRRERAERASASGQWRDDGRPVAVGDHEAGVLGALA